MGTVEVFSNNLYFSITIISLLLLFMVISYTSLDNKQVEGVWYLFWGIIFEFAGSWFGHIISTYQGDVFTYSILLAVELTLLVVALTLMAFAATELLIGKKSNKTFVWILAVLAFGSVFAFTFIIPSIDMIIKMRYAFPLVGFLYVSIAFWSKVKLGFGFRLAALITAAVSLALLLKLLGVDYVSENLWYLPVSTYVLLNISILIIKSDYLVYKLKDSRNKIQNHTTQIENIIKSSPFPIIISRLSDDKIIVANNNAIKLFGIKPSELERYKLKDFFVDQENRKLLNEHLEREKEIRDFEILVKTATGNTPFWLLTSANIIDYNYDITIYLAFQDITSRKNRETMLKNQAIRDPLTSLFNRRYFEDEVKQKASLAGPPFSILMIDVDKFKNVNDTYGHKVGDQVLIDLANTCVKALRDNDIVARFGGEEFVIYLHNTDEDKSKMVAERLRETIEVSKTDIGDDKTISITASIGIATSKLSTDIDTMVKMADSALYRAKNNGRNRVEIFEKDDSYKPEKASQPKQMHPIFEKEENQEISLLDGIDGNNIIAGSTEVEDVNDDVYKTFKESEE